MNEQVKYYQERAKEYERIYQKSERQADLEKIRRYLVEVFKGKSILEIACGTGYWTEVLAEIANCILATDINHSVLEIAEKKSYPDNNVVLERKDYKSLEGEKNEFDGLFAGFIWSHIPMKEIEAFLKILINQVKSGGTIMVLDNKYVAGSSTKICRTDSTGNTYQNRRLESGDSYEIIKNFPSKNELEVLVSTQTSCFEWIDFEHYWAMKLNPL